MKRFRSRWLWRRRKQGVKGLIVSICFLLPLTVWMFFQSRSVITVFAESRAVWVATKITNQIAAQILQENWEMCGEIISIAYDSAQHISAVKTDVAAVNTVRTQITDQIITEMERLSSLSVSLPLGTVLGWDWLSGWGATINFSGKFYGYGCIGCRFLIGGSWHKPKYLSSVSAFSDRFMCDIARRTVIRRG